MQGRDPPSLAAAVFDWPAAPGFTTPAQLIPADWLEQFISQHVLPDPAVLCGLFQSCGAGRQWVLARAPTATLTLDFSATVSAVTHYQRLPAVRQCLLARNSSSSSDSLPTKLVVVCDEQCAQYGPFSGLPHALADCGQAITDLQFRSGEGSQAPALSTASPFLAGMAAVCPRLTSLSTNVTCTLPTPAALPHLTRLVLAAMTWGQDTAEEHAPAVQSAARLLPQLTTLQVNITYTNPMAGLTVWHHLHTPDSTSHTLTSIQTDDYLDDAQLWLLLNYAPALQRLTVGHVHLESDEHAGRQWRLTELVCERANGLDRYRSSDTLVCLPVNSGGQMSIHVEQLALFVTSDQGLDPKLVDRLAEWVFHTKRVLVSAEGSPAEDGQAEGLPGAAHPAVLRAVLRQLGGLQLATAGADIVLAGWQWDADMAQTLADAAPLLPHLQFAVRTDQPLTDELLGAVLRMGPRMRRLSVPSIALQSGQHANTPWPWDELAVQAVDLVQVARLPEPQGAGAPRKVTGIHVITVGQEADPELVRARLQQISLSGPRVFTALVGPQDNQLETLGAQLSVVRALHCECVSTNCTSRAPTLWLNILNMTQDSIEALRGLPHWLGTLDLSMCGPWPLEPTQYKALAQAIPTSYTTWQLGNGVSQAVIESMCEGANERRVGLGLEPLCIAWPGCPEQRVALGRHVELAQPGAEWCELMTAFRDAVIVALQGMIK